jgi:hypothetical protein
MSSVGGGQRALPTPVTKTPPKRVDPVHSHDYAPIGRGRERAKWHGVGPRMQSLVELAERHVHAA